MQELFKAAIDRGASDVHIKAGDVIRARIHGELLPLTQQRLSAEQVKGIALKLIPHEEDRQNFDKLLDYDCSWGLPGIGRFRVNIMKQRGSPMIVMRVIPIEIPTIEDLALPPIIEKIANHERGMILVTGVGFLGAGTIMQSRGSVMGLTTAATMWVVAAIGMAVGFGAVMEAVGTTLLVLVALIPLRTLEEKAKARRERNGLRVTALGEDLDS